jgi:hypothetical protein
MAEIPLIRRIEGLLPLLSRGKFVEKCDDHLSKVLETLEALPEGKGKATITITLDVSYAEGCAAIKPTIKSKLPDEKGFSDTTFWTVDGALSTQHPNQFDMFPREVRERRESSSPAA